jgi:putative ABC transport system permease protein
MKSDQPPRLAKWLLQRMTKYQKDYSIVGDTEEVFFAIYRKSGYWKASRWYWYQCLVSLLKYSIFLFLWSMDMLKNYMIVAFRNCVRHKGITIFNIIGLSLGLAASLLILQFISYETSYDKFHENSENIYRVTYNYFEKGQKKIQSATAVPAIGYILKRNFPEVMEMARATREFLEYCAISIGRDDNFRESRILMVNPAFLTMMNFPMVKGDPKKVLSEPMKAVITKSTAEKYFKGSDPIGKLITYNGRHELEITGVCRDVPKNSHIKFDLLLSYKSLFTHLPFKDAGTREEAETSWGGTPVYTYISLQPGTDPQDLQRRINSWVREQRKADWEKNNYRQEFILQPLEDIHLYSNLVKEAEPREQGNGDAVKVLAVIAVFILILAWVNYINISTSRAMERAKEVGIRKVSGACRSELIKQFLSEYFGVSVVSVIIAILFVVQFSPFFSRVTGADFSFEILFKSDFWPAFLILFLLGTFLAGFYPAFVLSSFKPVSVLKGRLTKFMRGDQLRKLLVTFQLAVSVALIAGTLIIFKQISFMLDYNLGINISQTIVLHGPGANGPPPSNYGTNLASFANEIKKIPGVIGLTTSTNVPGEEVFRGGYIRRNGDPVSKALPISIVDVDFNFIPSFEIKLLAGRNFSKSLPTDFSAVILNKAAIIRLGYPDAQTAINQNLFYRRKKRPIIGVLDNYNQYSLRSTPIPLLFLLSEPRGFISIKIEAKNPSYLVGLLKDKWKQNVPGVPFDYFFLDEYFNRHYKNDQRFGLIFAIFSILTISIACLGLFALASHNTILKTKEIGVRKIVGASIANILFFLAKDFLRLVWVATLLAIPLAYLQMNNWLQNFAYRIPVNWWYFAISFLIVTIAVIATIAYQTFKAAISKPVDTLRYE